LAGSAGAGHAGGRAGGRTFPRAAVDPWVVAAAAVAIIVLVLLRTTLQPGVWFWDTAEAQTVPPLFGTMHPTGFPAYVVVGWLASALLTPFGEVAFRMNLLSAILVAFAAAGTVLVGRRLGLPVPVAAATGFGLAVTPIAWDIGLSADAHALHLALVVGLVIVLLGWERRVRGTLSADGKAAPTPGADRWLILAAVLFGITAANHSLALLLVPAIALYVLAVQPRILARPRLVFACLVAAVGTATLLYLQLPLRAGPWPAPISYGRPDTWDGFRYVVLAEQFRGSIVDPFGNLGGKVATLVEFTTEQLGPLVIFLPAAWVATLRWAPRYALLSGVAVLVTCFFSASYVNADIGRYYLGPAFFAWTWLGVLAVVVVHAFVGALPGRAVDAEPGTGRGARVVAVGVAVALLVPTIAAIPARHAAVDRSEKRDAERWLDGAFAALEPGAVVVSWWSYSTTLWYGQLIEGRRTDVWIVDDRTRLDEQLGDVSDVIDANLGRRPVYVIRTTEAEITSLSGRYELQPVASPSNIYRVVRPLETAR
jgi:hypothetical protein